MPVVRTAAVVLALWCLLMGCAPRVQDVRPFAGATAAMDAAVVAAYDGTLDAVARTAHLTGDVAEKSADPDDPWARLESTYAATGAYFTKLRSARRAALDAMRAHAASLVATADAGGARIERIEATRKGLNEFVTAAGSLTPLSVEGKALVAAVAAFIGAASDVRRALEALRTNTDLRRQVEAHADAVAALAGLLELDLRALDEQLALLGNAIESALLARDGEGLSALEDALRTWRDGEGRRLTDALTGAGTQRPTSGAAEQLKVYTMAEEALERVLARRGVLDARIDTRRGEIGVARAVVRSCHRTVVAWREAHANARHALAERTTVSLDDLTLALTELRARLDQLERLAEPWRTGP